MGNLKKHMMSHTKEKPFVCELCGKAYGRKSLLDNHRRLHTGEKPFKCTIEDCEKCFRSYSNLQQHIRSHSDSNPFVCDVCGKSFKQPGRLHYHRKDHFIEFRWPCAYCTSKFKSVFMYKNHLAKSHPEKRKEVEEKWNIRLYQCDLCSKTYGDKEDYTRHVYIHQGIKPFKCQYCHKAFNDKSNLKQHEKIHTGDRRFQCEICHKAFIHNKTRRLHMKSCEGKSKQAAKISELNAKAEHMKDMINPERAGVDLFSQERKVKGEPVNMTRRGMESTRNQYINESGYQSLDTNGVTDVGIDSQDPRSVIQPQHYILEPNEIPLQNIPIAAVNSLTGQIEPLLIIENY